MVKKLVPDPPHTFEESLLRIFDILRCAAAVTHELGDQQSGNNRHLAFAALYLVDMAKALADELIKLLEEHRATQTQN